MSNTADSVLAIARGELGYSRWDDPQPGTKYGRWYEEQIDRTKGNYDFGASGVPYCAMFVSWVFAQAGASCVGIPGAYCPTIVQIGRSRGKAVFASSAKPGDVVLFDWEGDGVSDHVGICEANGGSYLQCIEGNTNNGVVARRTRTYSSIVCVIRPDYGGAASSTPAASKPSSSGSASSGKLDVDGYWGKLTTTALQKALGTPADGIVSDQYIGYKAKNPGLESSSWEWHQRTSSGSQMVRALQKKVGAGVDGIAGDETFSKLQAYLGTPVDGCISSPSTCVKELQRRLNAGTF